MAVVCEDVGCVFLLEAVRCNGDWLLSSNSGEVFITQVNQANKKTVKKSHETQKRIFLVTASASVDCDSLA